MKRVGSYGRVVGGGLLLAGAFSLPAVADVSFTPRAGIYFDNGSQRQGRAIPPAPNTQAFLNQADQLLKFYGGTLASSTESSAKTEQAAIPQFGGTLTFSWGDSGSTDVALTALYGKAHVRGESFVQNTLLSYSVLGVNSIDNLAQGMFYDSEYKRLDLEGTIQHRLNETFSLVGGVRGERTTGDRPITVVETGSANFVNALQNELNALRVQSGLPPIPGAFVFPQGAPYGIQSHLTWWSYSLRAGAAAYAPIGERHLFFVNGMLHVTRTPGVSVTNTFANGQSVKFKDGRETFVGPDFSVGYIYQFSDRIGLDVRYRATVYFPIAGEFDFKDSKVKHGLMLGLTTWLGGR